MPSEAAPKLRSTQITKDNEGLLNKKKLIK